MTDFTEQLRYSYHSGIPGIGLCGALYLLSDETELC